EETNMAPANDPTPQKKPQAGPGASKPQAGKTPAGKPAPGKPAGNGEKAHKPAGKPAARPAGKAPARRPARQPPPVRAGSDRSGGRKIGQVMVDLGFMDADQLWELLDEAKNTNALLGQVAVARGLITEDQLLRALAEQHGLKVINLQE